MEHPALLHHPARGGIPGEVHGIDPVQPEDRKPVLDHRPDRLGGVSPAPAGPCDPEPELATGVTAVDLQADAADQTPLSGERDGEGRDLAAVDPLAEGGDPDLGKAVRVGVGKEGRRGNGVVAGEPLHHGSVREGKRSQEQAIGREDGLVLHEYAHCTGRI